MTKSQSAWRGFAIWPSHKVPAKEIRDAELRERVEASKQYSAANLELNEHTRPLFEAVAGVVRAVAPHFHELFGVTSVVYRVPDWFLEIVPRKRKLTLRLAAEPTDLAAVAPNIRSASEWSFVINSTVEGGSLFVMSDVSELPVVQALIGRAVTAISE
ncbi:MAG TPA: hypothetical protein VJM31_12545 [Vicinamibacterales bacterium]|nr:hypothetical protein [Vicinamibacterales bacterium]